MIIGGISIPPSHPSGGEGWGEGGFGIAPQLAQDCQHNFVEVAHHVIIREANDTVSHLPKRCSARGVVSFPIAMGVAIDLNDQFFGSRCEIGNVGRNDDLPLKLYAKPVGAEDIPQATFGLGEIGAQLLRTSSGYGVPLQEFPLSQPHRGLPLPLKGERDFGTIRTNRMKDRSSMRRAVTISALAGLAACSPFPEGQRRMESQAEINAKQHADFAASPDVRLPELKARLHALGVTDANMTLALDDYEPILMLTLTPAEYARLDKAALARLELDSRYRLRLNDPQQVHDLARISGADMQARDRAIAQKELADKGEMERFPRFVPGHSMTIYARQLEAYCGYPPDYALRVIDGKWLEYRNQIVFDAAMAGASGRSTANFHCLRRIVYATDLGRHFIGNRPLPGATDS